MKIPRSPRRLRVALAASLAMGGFATALLPAMATTPPCRQPVAGCAVLVAQAQDILPMPQPIPVPVPVTDSGKSRGVFLSMFAQALIPSLVSGIDGWLRNKLNLPTPSGPGDHLQAGNLGAGSRPAMQPLPMPMPMPMAGSGGMAGESPMLPAQSQTSANAWLPPQGRSDDIPGLQAGVAYQVSLLGRDGTRTLVDPAQRAFATGERIAVAYRTNLPGLVEVYNIDSTGREELIDQQQMGAGQLANLGPYEFVNVKGEETLRIVLRPCVGGAENPATRGMVRAQITPELGNTLVGCEDPMLRQSQRSGTRGIAKVQLEGGTHYALDPVSRNEIDSGRLAPREVRVRFLHQ